MKIVLDVISHNNRLQNTFMQSCDVFEPGKFIGSYEQYNITGNDSMDIEKLPTTIADAIFAAGGYALFVAVRSADAEIIVPNLYFKQGVQTISNGQKFGLFRDKLERLGYVVETDEFMHVTKVSYPVEKQTEIKFTN